MSEISVHEHVRKELPPPEFLRFKIMKSQHVVQVNSALLQYNCGQEKNSVDDEKILDYFRKKAESLGTVLLVHKNAGAVPLSKSYFLKSSSMSSNPSFTV